MISGGKVSTGRLYHKLGPRGASPLDPSLRAVAGIPVLVACVRLDYRACWMSGSGMQYSGFGP